MNLQGFLGNAAVNDVDPSGLLAAEVKSVDYNQHGSAEPDNSYWQYILVPGEGQHKTDWPSEPRSATAKYASITLTLSRDAGDFSAGIRASTSLAGSRYFALQLSSGLDGSVKVCCPCPFRKVRARWSAVAVATGPLGTGGAVSAGFGPNPVNDAKALIGGPTSGRSGTVEGDLDYSYCHWFAFRTAANWTDANLSVGVAALVKLRVSFECTE